MEVSLRTEGADECPISVSRDHSVEIPPRQIEEDRRGVRQLVVEFDVLENRVALGTTSAVPVGPAEHNRIRNGFPWMLVEVV